MRRCIRDQPAGVRQRRLPVKAEYSNDNANWSKKSLKLTFSGGRFPTVSTDSWPRRTSCRFERFLRM